ncbi:hypothetical protein GW17_00050862 [Ensete ventricosum]|nr:hypothetical protein GW17_00050862 [Ensete ventricosum]
MNKDPTITFKEEEDEHLDQSMMKCRLFTEGIRKITRNTLVRSLEEDQKTHRKNVGLTGFYRNIDATQVEIAAIHLEGDVIQWFNWFEHTHGGLSWQRFKEGLLNRFRPTDFDNIDEQLTKIRQTSIIQEY